MRPASTHAPAGLASCLGEDEIIIDLFAGGGGASAGIEAGAQRPVAVAVNHSVEAVRMHAANHPGADHYCESVWTVDPLMASRGRPVGILWASPDCTHFSRAKGGKPRDKNIRGLAWAAAEWVKALRPRIFGLENVREFLDWNELLDDGRPCPNSKGKTFREFVGALELLGYVVEHRVLRACNFGAPTSRERLVLIARRDGLPIVWPTATHGEPDSLPVMRGQLLPWRSAAECIDWSHSVPSIFLSKADGLVAGVRRPLVTKTLERIGRGLNRFVFRDDKRYVLPARDAAVSAFLTEHANGSCQRNFNLMEPVRTICAETKGGTFALVSAFLIKNYGGGYTGPGAALTGPMPTITANDHNALGIAVLQAAADSSRRADLLGYLDRYCGRRGEDADIVEVNGERYRIADICMRMLQPNELYRAMGFPEHYVFDRDVDGAPFSKKDQIRRCGNSVPPPLAEAVIRANVFLPRSRLRMAS